jgi:hypothetical protein
MPEGSKSHRGSGVMVDVGEMIIEPQVRRMSVSVQLAEKSPSYEVRIARQSVPEP